MGDDMAPAGSGSGRSRSRWRPQTPQDFGLLKSVRYEEAENGTPPVPVTTVAQNRGPSTGSSVKSKASGDLRPQTAPVNARGSAVGLAERRKQFEGDFKRDSGIANSTTTPGRDSYSDSHQGSSPLSHAAREPTLPTIVVNDDEPAQSPTSERKSSWFSRKENHSNKLAKTTSNEETGHKRLKSFHGIETDIPTGSWDDFDSEKIGFSHRGSLLFGGKKMSQMIEAQGKAMDEDAKRESLGNMEEPARQEEAPRIGKAITTDSHADRSPKKPAATDASPQRTPEQPPASPPPPTPKPGLVTGKRKPSVQMLQAAIHGGRVLSAEEITFSMRVRSMYEAGDEKAAQWSDPMYNGSSIAATLEDDRSTPEPDAENDGLTMAKTRPPRETLRSPSPAETRNSYIKSKTELAGGIEDWEDVKGADVDRYGFIQPDRAASRDSAGSSIQPGLHRVATGLRLAADQPRRERSMIRHRNSNARSSRSAPPAKPGAPSVRSFNSSRSGSSHPGRFRSRDQRTTDTAGNMLIGLPDIAEHQENGKTANFLRRREYLRGEKWQAMARPRERSNSPGGGMNFDFNTNDSKLINRTWKGIPDRWRAAAWHSFLSTSAKRRGAHASDEELIEEFHRLQETNCADDVQIDVDVPRTISMHIMFRRRYRGGQRLLFRVLHAIALYCPDTGYVQGMASLAATLLCYFDEENAFIMLVRLWKLRGLEQLFRSGFDGLMAALKEFEDQWLCGGDVALKLDELGITSTAYGTRWYLTLFNMSVPFAAQLRIWDVFMLLGDATPSAPSFKEFGGADLDVLHATSAALIDATREIILDSDFEGAMKVLTSFVPIKDEDLLMRVAKAEYRMKKKRG